MYPGIFARVWAGHGLDETLDRMTGFGIRHTQFNLACVGLAPLPDEIPAELAERVRSSFARQGVSMVAVSGTFNLIHPDRAVVADGLRRLGVLAAACPALGARLITLCTGTRDPDDMWRWHPDNASPAAWRDLLSALERALELARVHDVILGIEPEQANVVHSARGARRLLDHFASSHLKIIIDPANLFEKAEPPEIERTVEEACALLGADIVLAHAKDRDAAGRFVPAGQGVLNYDHYISQLQRVDFSGAVVLHGLSEDQAPGCIEFLRRSLQHAAR